LIDAARWRGGAMFIVWAMNGFVTRKRGSFHKDGLPAQNRLRAG